MPVLSPHAQLQNWLQAAWSQVFPDPFPARSWAICPRPELGELTHAGALRQAQRQRCAPLPLARQWAEKLEVHPWVSQVRVDPPGHLNLRLSDAGIRAFCAAPLGGFDSPPPLPSTLVEFVSANPTGPLHLGHARQAILGDVLARLIQRCGGVVEKEFFYNDAGVQIDKLVESVQLRRMELEGTVLKFERDGATLDTLKAGEVLFPANGYHGDYIREVAQAQRDQGIHNADVKPVRQHAIACLQAEQREDLAALGVVFDAYTSERGLHESGKVSAVLEGLSAHTYRATHAIQDAPPTAPRASALFLQTTLLGDDKDRVMVKSDGSVTYFVPDVAYHVDKWDRGWARAINIQGSDHHGTLKRVQAGVQWLRPEAGPNYPQVLFHTMVKVVKHGQPLKASKRAGDYLTARDLVGQVGKDAFRLAMLDKKPESEVTLDVDLWVAQNAANPVYNVQYAHARLCTAVEKALAAMPGQVAFEGWVPAERRLLVQLMLWSDRLDQACEDNDPVRASYVVRDLAASVHEAYQQGPKLLGLATSARQHRLALFERAMEGLREGTRLLGVACPSHMAPSHSDGTAENKFDKPLSHR